MGSINNESWYIERYIWNEEMVWMFGQWCSWLAGWTQRL